MVAPAPSLTRKVVLPGCEIAPVSTSPFSSSIVAAEAGRPSASIEAPARSACTCRRRGPLAGRGGLKVLFCNFLLPFFAGCGHADTGDGRLRIRSLKNRLFC
jgi:hypothetical protein